MGCGCNKNKQNMGNTFAQGPGPSRVINTEVVPEFRPQTTEPPKNFFAKKLGMVQSFAGAIVSRGLANIKINKPTKQLRALSCFGNMNTGGILPPCEHLKQSSTPGKYFCGGCGCGDKPHTWLTIEGEQYSQLDYPKVVCPINMPGFSNYEQSKPDEAISPITRRYFIEQIDFGEVLKINVTLPETPEELKTPEPT